MKTAKAALGILTTTAGLVAQAFTCAGQSWVGTDDFSSGISTDNWTIYNYLYGGQMAVVGADGHVSFIVPISTTSEQSAAIAWNGLPTAADDWTADISGHNSAAWSTNGSSQLQLWVLESPALTTGYRISMAISSQQVFNVKFYPDIDDGSILRQSVPATNTTFGLRLVHTGGVAGDVEAWYDPTGNGTAWTLLDTMNMSDCWPGVVSTNTFTVGVVANTYYGPIAEGQLWADNFRITNSALGSAPTGTRSSPLLDVTLSLTLSQQNASKDNGVTTTTPLPKVRAYATADILSILALDEHLKGNWPDTNFPRTAKLAIAGDYFVVADGTNILLNVSDLMSVAGGESKIISGTQSDATSLASRTMSQLRIVRMTFDDTAIIGGSNLRFWLQGLCSESTADSLPVRGFYTETITAGMSNAAGEGSYQDVPFVCTGAAFASGTARLELD